MFVMFSRWLIGLFICALILATGYLFWFKNGVDFIYGAHTDVVDHAAFAIPISPTAITNVNVLSPDGRTMLPRHTVLLDGGKIVAVSANATVPINATVINGNGKYLIPGLVDSHAHILKSPNDLLLYVANGVTHVRDLGGPIERLKLRREIEQGRVGPRLFVSSPPIDSMGLLEGAFFEVITFHKNTRGVEHAISVVEDFAEQGYDAIKTYHLDMPSYRAVNKKAAELGIPTTGHFPLSMELSELAISEQNEVAHIEEIVRVLIREFGTINTQNQAAFYAHVESRSSEIAGHLLANNIPVNSVLWFMESVTEQFNDLDKALRHVHIAYANPGILEGTNESGDYKVGWLPSYNQFEPASDISEDERQGQAGFWLAREKAHHILLKGLVRRGVTIMAGTDSGANLVVPGFSIHDELSSLNSAGMSTAQALESATANPSKVMNSNAGIIDVGRRADLVMLNKNPLIDINNTRAIDTVILNGRVFARGQLDAMLAAVYEANENSRNINIDEYK
jgi:hypothetical protein